MRTDTNKLCIALCGPLPGAIAQLERRKDVEYTTFSDGNALYDSVEDAAPFDFMVVRSDAGAGLVPLYYPGCDGNCLVYLAADPKNKEEIESLHELIDLLLEEKRGRIAKLT